MRKILLSIFVVSTLLGAGCNNQPQEQQKLADLEFKRNQTCGDYLTSIKDNLQKTENDLNKTGYQIGVSVNIIFNKLFYSNKYNSCLYSYSIEQRVSEDGKEAAKSMGNTNLKDQNITMVRNRLTDEVLFRNESKEKVDEWIKLNN